MDIPNIFFRIRFNNFIPCFQKEKMNSFYSRTYVVFLAIIIWVTSSSILYEPNEAKGFFGVRISFQANGELLSFIAYQQKGSQILNKRYLDKELFIRYASGVWPNIYNPKRINYFESYSLACGCIKDSFSRKETLFCDPLDSLWKLRFASYPFQGNMEDGWSQELYRPSNNQLKFLKHEYGINSIDGEYFRDTSFWKLLKDVQNENWIYAYRSL